MADSPQGLTASDTGKRSYTLGPLLGRGGCGEVYRGKLTGTSGFTKTVAIKVLLAEGVEAEEMARRLRDEARLLALLSHRAIVHVEDLVQIDGRWAVVMEYVEGFDLRQLLKSKPIPLRPALEIVGEAAAALRTAHEAVDPDRGTPLKIVHRDIKPANIKVTPAGEVKVLDFGIARAAFVERETLTRDSISFGSMGYLAPERYDGIDVPGSDVYSLGIVLYEIMTGEAVGQLSVHPERHAARVDELIAGLTDVPPELGGFLRSMLEYNPAARPSSTDVVRQFRDMVGGVEGPWLNDWAEQVIRPHCGVGTKGFTPPPSASTSNSADTIGPTNRERVGSGPTDQTILRPVSPRMGPSILLSVVGCVALIAAGGLTVLVAGWVLGETSSPRTSVPVVEENQMILEEPDPIEETETPEVAVEVPVLEPPPPVLEPDTPSTESADAEEETQDEPEPASQPEPEPPATGMVRINGDHTHAQLVDAAGVAYSPGMLKVGTYDLLVTFPNAVKITQKGAVKVRAGTTVTIKCAAAAENCR